MDSDDRTSRLVRELARLGVALPIDLDERANQLVRELAAEKAAQMEGAKAVLSPLTFILAATVFALSFWRYDIGLALSIGAALLTIPIILVGVALPIGYVLGKREARRFKAPGRGPGGAERVMEEPHQGNAVIANFMPHIAAIRLCLEHHLRMPALALIYCGIDVLASLSRPAENAEVKRADFINWAERYMECEKVLGLSGIDLYAARCGVLHAYTMDSNLSATGRARRIIYAWGNREPDEPMKLLKTLGFPEIMIKIEALFSAFQDGIRAFEKELKDDPKLELLVRERGPKIIQDRTTFP